MYIYSKTVLHNTGLQHNSGLFISIKNSTYTELNVCNEFFRRVRAELEFYHPLGLRNFSNFRDPESGYSINITLYYPESIINQLLWILIDSSILDHSRVRLQNLNFIELNLLRRGPGFKTQRFHNFITLRYCTRMFCVISAHLKAKNRVKDS